MTSRAVLIVLDGFGIGKDSAFNAIKNARMPFYKDLLANYPHSQLLTHGKAVGLPDGVMGNSEVGHMTMGAGRIIYQDLTRISNSIDDKSFFKNPILKKTLEAGAAGTGRVHFMGLLSDAGVHSHLGHLKALLNWCMELRVPQICIHAFTDGRDTPPNSAVKYMHDLLSHPIFEKSSPCKAGVATVSGRYYAMDRDKRWDRVEKAYSVLTGQSQNQAGSKDPIAAIEKSYELGKTDEFVEPVILDPKLTIQSGDAVVFFNYRSDRAREISQSLMATDFNDFSRGSAPKPGTFACMTQYSKDFPLPVAFGAQNLSNIFGSWLEQKKLQQFRIAETEKYAHVTFFFNGGVEKPFQGEERLLVPSPKDVPTYDLKPEMSAFTVAQEAATKISSQQFDFVLMNFANADMVGHTGNYGAAVKAMEALDKCLSQVIGAAQKSDYHVLLTADHGNAEEMHDDHGQIHTQHTLNPVPAIWIQPGSAIAPKKTRQALKDGGLQDIMPTLCTLMGLPIPPEVTGKSLC